MEQPIQPLLDTLDAMDKAFQRTNQTSESILTRILGNVKKMKAHQTREWIKKAIIDTQRSVMKLASNRSHGLLQLVKGNKVYLRNEIALLESAKKAVSLNNK